jgi:DNA-directed RNA polymerase subunit beta'
MLIKEQRASKDSLHPQILLRDKSGKTISQFHLPELAEIEVKDGQTIRAGTLLAKRPRSSGGTQDITSGLPRVTELFENRQPKDPAVLAETDGMVTAIDRKRNKRTIVITNQQTGEVREHLVPQSKYLKVHVGDTVHSGEALVEGPLYPQDVLRISGVDKVQEYLLDEVQKVYRAQGVAIDDKHIEIIVSQMLRKVKVVESGDSDFLPGNQVDRAFFKREALRIREAQGKPPVGEPLLLGITKAALQSDSFISAASFQETTKVLTQAAMAGKRDSLMGLKENVILGHLIPAGTGFTEYHRTVIKHQFENGGAAGASAS